MTAMIMTRYDDDDLMIMATDDVDDDDNNISDDYVEVAGDFSIEPTIVAGCQRDWLRYHVVISYKTTPLRDKKCLYKTMEKP